MTKATKTKFVREYPINASAKLLYPYLSTPGGLSQWFCDDVTIDADKIYNFLWDGRNHFAELTGHRTNRSIRFLFLGENKAHLSDASYIDFSIESSDLTQEQYLKVMDYTSEEDIEELEELWENLMQNLREIVGG
ncbi:START-like domain-containing protein [Pontibacter sp. E15-1]|uniref:START-like domain-containing protein n=1 Tax=Pontibacter sp. E15-1 TaxID=2919918 RepID=UPI001F4FCE8C|nr:START-like domain-containing protein [Pontibacter sp. E15-1]MCJ8163714.1 START-like domain-containing protein [Pontibacter sp. E15-1]